MPFTHACEGHDCLAYRIAANACLNALESRARWCGVTCAPSRRPDVPARGAYGRERTTGARGVRAERRDVVLTGSLAVVDALRQEDLVDEYRLMTFLVVLGQGRRLFPDGTSPAGLECLSAAHVPLGRRLPGLRRFAA